MGFFSPFTSTESTNFQTDGNPRGNYNAGVCVCAHTHVYAATEHTFISKFGKTFQEKAKLLGR